VEAARMTHPLLLQAQGLSKSFGGLRATDGVDLAVRAGDIHALIGPNGAGKTTLIQLLSGSLRPDAGQLLFDGMDITAMPVPQRVVHGLVRSFQITCIFERLSVLDNLALAVLGHAGEALRFWRPARRDVQRYAFAREVADRVGLAADCDRLAAHLSHGQQRLLEVGLALASRPKLLLLDEPMAGLGPDESEPMMALIDGLRGETTVLLVEHDMGAVFRLADRISALVQGRIVASGPPDEIRAHPEVRQAYLGEPEATA